MEFSCCDTTKKWLATAETKGEKKQLYLDGRGCRLHAVESSRNDPWDLVDGPVAENKTDISGIITSLELICGVWVTSSSYLLYQVTRLLQVTLNAGSMQCSFTFLISAVPL